MHLEVEMLKDAYLEFIQIASRSPNSTGISHPGVDGFDLFSIFNGQNALS